MKKSQITVAEIPLLILLISSSIIYFTYEPNINLIQNKDYSVTINSFLNAIYSSDEFRNIIMKENLSSVTITENWTNMSKLLNETFGKYELIISNNTVSKKIFSCNTTYNKFFSEKIISIQNNSDFEFRKIKLGVCY